jgi:iron complex outermembrane recepter protein
MKHSQHPLRAQRAAPLALAIAVGILAAPAYAQTEDDTTLDRIEVTGSRIRRVDTETSQPVLTITREDIEKQGFQSVTDILQNLSAMGNPPLSRANPLGAGEAAGGQFISLRDLGANRTLVLLNGRRVGVTTAGIQDISLIPVSIIERVEVLKDGASSIYGSDAIAGVVNLITRSNWNGMQANAYYGEQSEGDGEIEKYDVVFGATGDRTNITMAVEYGTEGRVRAADRPFSAFPRSSRHPDLGWTTVSQWGVITLPASLGGNRVLNAGGDFRSLTGFHALNGTAPTGDVSNTNQQTDLRTPVERRSFFANGYFDITDTIRFNAEALYGQRAADRQVAGYPFQSAAFGTPMSSMSYYNPIGTHHGFATPANVGFWRRTWEVPRIETATTDTWRFAASVEGSFELADRFFDWDVSWLYNNNEIVQENYGNLNVSRIAQAVGPSFLNAQGVVQCGTAAAPIALTTCVPWNPFIPFGRTGDGGLTDNQALQNFLFQTLNSTGDTETMVASANLSGEIVQLPAGPLGFAVGLEHRTEQGSFTPDAMAVTGNSTTLSAGPTEGKYSIDEAYAEVLVPILTDVAFARELSLNAATRYSDYDTFGSTTNHKAGFKWSPVESLLFRGTWAEGFRAPTIANLFGGGSQTFSFFTDPCDTVYGQASSDTTVRSRCAPDVPNAATFRQLQQGFVPSTQANAQTPVAFFSGSNPNLLPEISVGRNLGFVWSPEFLEGFNTSIDWWKIRVSNTMVTDTPTQILFDCYVQNIASRCANFTRDPTQGYVNTMTFGLRNAGYAEVEGYDVDFSYKWETGFGAFNASLLSTYVTKNEFKTTNDENVLPNQLNSFGSNYRVRSNFSLSWTWQDFGVSYGARYYSKMKEACLSAVTFPEECSDPGYISNIGTTPTPINVVGSNTFHDLQVRWNAPWDAVVSVGANNVTDHYGPPLYTQVDANVSYNGGFDIGRFWYVKYQHNF